MNNKNEVINYTPTKDNQILSIINKILAVIIVLLILSILVVVFVVSPKTIVGESMMPTLKNEQTIWIQKVGYKLKHGDIIVFELSNEAKPPIKRIIAMEGDTIRFDSKNKVWVRNGEPIAEPYTQLAHNNDTYAYSYFENSVNDLASILQDKGLTLQKDELFVLGDNRNISYDSHNYGVIKTSWVKGKYLQK